MATKTNKKFLDEDGVLGKTMIVGQSAVLMMDSNLQVVNGVLNREVTQEEENQVSNNFDVSKGDALPKYAIRVINNMKPMNSTTNGMR